MNYSVIVGRLTKNPEVFATQNGKTVAKINLACNNTKDDTTFLEITVFDKMAETVHIYTKKGDMLGVNFIIKNKNWEDKEGKKHYDYQFIATRVHFLHKADTTKDDKPVEKEEPKKDAYAEFGNSIKAEQLDDIPDDMLPF